MQPGVRVDQKYIDGMFKTLDTVVVGEPLSAQWRSDINITLIWCKTDAANKNIPYTSQHLWSQMCRGKPVKEEWYQEILNVYEWDDPRKPVTEADII